MLVSVMGPGIGDEAVFEAEHADEVDREPLIGFSPTHAVDVIAFCNGPVDHVVTALPTAVVMDVIGGVANAELRPGAGFPTGSVACAGCVLPRTTQGESLCALRRVNGSAFRMGGWWGVSCRHGRGRGCCLSWASGAPAVGLRGSPHWSGGGPGSLYGTVSGPCRTDDQWLLCANSRVRSDPVRRIPAVAAVIMHSRVISRKVWFRATRWVIQPMAAGPASMPR